jgi:hypothetical protein
MGRETVRLELLMMSRFVCFVGAEETFSLQSPFMCGCRSNLHFTDGMTTDFFRESTYLSITFEF